MNCHQNVSKKCRRSPKGPIAIIVTLTAMLSGCAHGGAHPATESPTGAVGPSSAVAPLSKEATADSLYGPQPAPGYVPPKDGYVLVFGPGLARALAYVGVLRELEARGQPVHAVIGVEMGAVVAGIWASSNINNLEWQIHKFKKETLLDVSVFGLGARVAEGRKLYEFLDDAVKVSQLQQMKVQTLIASAVLNSDTILTEGNGSAKDIIRGAMGIPGIIKSFSWDSKTRESAAFEQPFPVQAAKGLAVGKVVCVDVIGRGDNFMPKEGVETQIATLMRSVGALARQQLKDCDAVISVPMDDVSYLDFEARAELISRGQMAVQKWLGPQ